MNISDFIMPASRDMESKLDVEISAALDAALPCWTLLDVQRRCEWIKVVGSPVEALYLDGSPILEFGPIEAKTELRGDSYVTTLSRQIRRIPHSAGESRG